MPNISDIRFGGVGLPCKVEDGTVLKKAARKFKRISVPGRNGDIFYQQDAYENVKIKYKICSGKNADVHDTWRQISEALFIDGYQELSDITDLNHFRLGVFNGPIDAEYYWLQTGRATIEFDCRPERFLNSGTTNEKFNSSPGTITNPTSFAAKPLLYCQITSGGSGTITINDTTLTITSIPGTVFYLNCETQDCYGGSKQNRNKYVSGTYPVLAPGSNTVAFSGDITSVWIKPRWWEL